MTTMPSRLPFSVSTLRIDLPPQNPRVVRFNTLNYALPAPD